MDASTSEITYQDLIYWVYLWKYMNKCPLTIRPTTNGFISNTRCVLIQLLPDKVINDHMKWTCEQNLAQLSTIIYTTEVHLSSCIKLKHHKWQCWFQCSEYLMNISYWQIENKWQNYKLIMYYYWEYACLLKKETNKLISFLWKKEKLFATVLKLEKLLLQDILNRCSSCSNIIIFVIIKELLSN